MGFSSPAARRGPHPDGGADVYSLGAIWYTMLVGNTPFTGQQRAMSFQQITSDPSPPSRRIPGIPAEVDEVVLKMMARSAADRPTLHDVAQVIESLGRSWTPSDADLWWRTTGHKVRDAVRRRRRDVEIVSAPTTKLVAVARRP
jgi:serine/threonine protein kinase